MFRQISYVSSCLFPLEARIISDILEESIRNNQRDGVTGVLMYHDRMFFQIIEGKSQLVAQCYDRICADRRHTGISKTLDEMVEGRSFPNWVMGYVGPDEIDEHTDGALLSLADLKTNEVTGSEKRGVALSLAEGMFEQFSKR